MRDGQGLGFPQPVAKPLDWRRQLSGQLRPAALPYHGLPCPAQPRKGATPHPPTPYHRIKVLNRQLCNLSDINPGWILYMLYFFFPHVIVLWIDQITDQIGYLVGFLSRASKQEHFRVYPCVGNMYECQCVTEPKTLNYTDTNTFFQDQILSIPISVLFSVQTSLQASKLR